MNIPKAAIESSAWILPALPIPQLEGANIVLSLDNMPLAGSVCFGNRSNFATGLSPSKLAQYWGRSLEIDQVWWIGDRPEDRSLFPYCL
jgi:hypothetical protein